MSWCCGDWLPWLRNFLKRSGSPDHTWRASIVYICLCYFAKPVALLCLQKTPIHTSKQEGGLYIDGSFSCILIKLSAHFTQTLHYVALDCMLNYLLAVDVTLYICQRGATSICFVSQHGTWHPISTEYGEFNSMSDTCNFNSLSPERIFSHFAKPSGM